ncbi:MAG: hypothetical protein KGL58_00365 [Pseudomonadota bacterium]|nr:hypothetical protein [Pseudomonadota bacterium]
MFTLPSMWNLIISTIVFFIAAWYFHRVLEEHGLPKGMTRGLLVFMLASVISWGAGDAVDWVQGKVEGSSGRVQNSQNLTQLLDTLSQLKRQH